MRNTGIVVEFDKRKSMDSFNALIKKVKRAGVAIKAFASAVALTGRRLNGDPSAFKPGSYLRAKTPKSSWF